MSCLIEKPKRATNAENCVGRPLFLFEPRDLRYHQWLRFNPVRYSLIKQSGYDDVVVTFFTQPGRVTAHTEDWSTEVQHGQSAMKVTFK